MGQYRNYSDEDVIRFAKEVKSISKMLKKLGLKAAGGNFAHMKKTLQRLKIDCSHWTGQGWSKDQQLKDWSGYSRVAHLKRHLIKLRGHKCQSCSNSEWLGKPIMLEVHHSDNDRTNNNLENLMLNCPNCHAQTDGWRQRKDGTL